MNFWTDIKETLNDRNNVAINLLLLILFVYVLHTASDYRALKIPLLFIGLLCWFVLGKKIKHPYIWWIFLAILLWDLYNSYFKIANHHFLLVYMTLIVILFIYNQRSEILSKNVQLLLVIVLLSSALQKLLSHQFISGDFYYYMMSKGFFFKPFLRINPEIMDIARSNYDAITVLEATDPNVSKSIILEETIPHLSAISFIFSWLTIGVEFLSAIAILWKPRNKWAHLLLILLIIGVFLTRLETGFLALLAISGIILTKSFKFRLVYVTLALLFVTLVVTKIGFH